MREKSTTVPTKMEILMINPPYVVGLSPSYVVEWRARLDVYDTESTSTAQEVVRGSLIQTGSISGGIHINFKGMKLSPRQLPPRRPVTRPDVQAAIEAMGRVLEERERADAEAGYATDLIIVVTGPPGSGATTAALAFLHQHAHRFTTHMHVNFDHTTEHADNLTTPAQVIDRWLIDFGVPPDETPPGLPMLEAWWRSITQDGLAMLIDGATSPGQVRPLLPGGPSLILITSRTDLAGLVMRDGARMISLL